MYAVPEAETVKPTATLDLYATGESIAGGAEKETFGAAEAGPVPLSQVTAGPNVTSLAPSKIVQL